jgi:hypothetical protein
MALSSTKPTTFELITATYKLRFCKGVYTARSSTSDTKNAAPEASANPGDSNAESPAPIKMPASEKAIPKRRCTRSRSIPLLAPINNKEPECLPLRIYCQPCSGMMLGIELFCHGQSSFDQNMIASKSLRNF